MVTNQGYIFSKEAILNYFLTQKELKKKELKEWEQAQQAVSDLVRALGLSCCWLSSSLFYAILPAVTDMIL